MKWIELLRKDDYALLQSESDTQYAVVSGYDPTQPEDQQWSNGTYFEYWNDTKRKADCLQNTLDNFRGKTEENYVTKGQKYLEIYAEILKEEITNYAPDIVTEIKCPNGQYKNRPLLDMATVVEIIDDLKKKMAE